MMVLGSALVAMTACSSADGATAPAQPEWLYIVQPDSPASFDAVTGTLTLPTNSVVAFTDRPYRMTRTLDADSFARLWDGHDGDSFAADPPNAVLTFWEPDGETWAPRTVVCEIVGTVTHDGPSLGLSVPIRLLDTDGAEIPSVLQQPSLFVDGFTPCPSTRDEQNVDYFNEMLFLDAYTIGVAPSSAGGSTTLTMQCPTPPTGVPFSSTFYVTLTTNDDSGSTSCTTDGLSVPTADLGNLGYCSADGTCSFTLMAGDSMTGLVYSTTSLEIDVTRARTVVPQVNQAVAPACPTSPPQPFDTMRDVRPPAPVVAEGLEPPTLSL